MDGILGGYFQRPESNSEVKSAKLPTHWIGVRKHYLDTCTTIEEAFVSVTAKQLDCHAYLSGSSGYGKSTGLLSFLNRDIESGHGLICLDMHGDNIDAALELCAGRVEAERILHFDLRQKEPLPFDPLYGSGEFYWRAMNVFSAICNDNDLGPQTSETLRYCLLLLAENRVPLTCIESLLTNQDFRSKLLKNSSSEPMRLFWERFNALSSEKQSTGYVSPVLNKLSLLFATDGLRKMIGHKRPVDLGKHLNTPGSITLISLAVDELHNAGRCMGKLFLSAIWREVCARVTLPESLRVPVRLYVDEIQTFDMEIFEEVLAQARRFKLSLVLANQIPAQLPPKTRSMILSNVGVKLYFRASYEDSALLSKDLTGDSKAFDLAALPRGEAILWCRDQKPIHIELNEPLIKDVGKKSERAKRLLMELRRLAPPYIPYEIALSVQPTARKPLEMKVQSLEEWL